MVRIFAISTIVLLIIAHAGNAQGFSDNIAQPISMENSSANKKPSLSGKTIFSEAKGKILRWKLDKDDVIEIQKISDQYIELRSPVVKKKKINRQVIHWITLKVIGKDNDRGYLLDGDFNSQFRYTRNKYIPYQADENHSSKFYFLNVSRKRRKTV